MFSVFFINKDLWYSIEFKYKINNKIKNIFEIETKNFIKIHKNKYK